MGDLNLLKKVISAIRGRIIDGTWPPGMRLPTRINLAEMVNSSPATVQMAIHALVSEGSVVTRKRAGSFIAEHPPELGLFALVIAKPLGDLEFRPNFFHAAMIRAAACVAKRHPYWRMDFFDSRDPRLLALVDSHALAGLLFFGNPNKNPAYGLTHIPQASFYFPGQNFIHGVNIFMDSHQFLDCGIQALLRRNITQIGVMASSGALFPAVESQPLGEQVQRLAENIRTAGGLYRPEWIQAPEVQNPLAIYQLTRLLFSNPLSRPQGLLLMDDHLLPPVQAAISDLGLRIPQDVALCTLAHTRPQTAADQLIRIGFDTEDFMLDLVQILAHLRRCNPGPTHLNLAFEELTPRLPD